LKSGITLATGVEVCVCRENVRNPHFGAIQLAYYALFRVAELVLYKIDVLRLYRKDCARMSDFEALGLTGRSAVAYRL
jgi:hypothetical protein